jgi:hypothetical protein
MKRIRVLSVLPAFGLALALSAGSVPARAQTPTPGAPANFEPYSRPSWGVSVAHPPEWSLAIDKDDVFGLGVMSGDDQVAFVMAADPAWRDPAYDWQQLLQDLTRKTGGGIDNPQLQPAPARTVAGIRARVMVARFTDRSANREVRLEMFHLPLGDKGYAIAEGAYSDRWAAHAPDFEAMLASLTLTLTQTHVPVDQPPPRRLPGSRATATPAP